MVKTTAAIVATLAGLIQSTAVHAQEAGESRASYTLGLRVWNAAWSAGMPTLYTGATPGGVPVVTESLDDVPGKRRTEAFPSLAVRKDKFVVSASYAKFSTDFQTPYSSFPGPNGVNVITPRTDHLDRKESDLTAGYFVTPNVALSLGFKYAEEGRTSTAGLSSGTRPVVDNTARALLLGASAAFPIQGSLLFTGQIAYGPARIKSDYADNAISDSTNTARYLISEIGVSYALGIKSSYIRGASVGLGYRTQQVRTKTNGASQQGGRDFRNDRDGVIATLNFTI
jgi:hypothetical protein